MKSNKIINVLFFAVIFLIFSCSTTYKTGSEGEKYKIPKDLSSFLHSFEKSVTLNDSAEILSHIDKNYIKEQLENMLEGRTEQFLNEFFSGNNVDGSGFVSVKYNTIKGIYFSSLQKNESGYTVYYIIETKDAKVECTWEISEIKTTHGTIYGLIGAVG